MGITGLIPFLEKASKKINIKELQGCTVAVDTYCWLHKGAFACAEKLSRGEDTDIHIQYCLKFVNLLLSHDIKPILVFDGGHLPAKAGTEKRRRESRENSKKRAAELLRLGRIDEARSHMRRCVDITHEMALKLIQECRQRNVDCIVAPYEADAQMAYLNKVGIAQYVITEDSDLVLFGCKNIIFKLDLNGNCLLVEADKLHLAMGCRPEKFTFVKFRTMCILSGCDYLDSLPGIGLAKACKFVLKTEETNIRRMLLKIPQYLNMRHLTVTEEYVQEFCVADATFKHMFVYDPQKRTMVRLNETSDLGTDPELCSNAGNRLDDETAFQLALGNLNPFTLKRLDTWDPDKHQPKGGTTRSFKQHAIAKHKSIWHSDYTNHKIQTKNSGKQFAFQLKKVDFGYSKIFQEEEIGQRETSESSILSLYTENNVPPTKRRCIERETSPESELVSGENGFDVINSSTKTFHNSFTKISGGGEKQTHINGRSSFLKVVSPGGERKCDLINAVQKLNRVTNANAIKEVKSRFFLSNITLVKNTEGNSLPISTCAININSKDKEEKDSSDNEYLPEDTSKNLELLYQSSLSPENKKLVITETSNNCTNMKDNLESEVDSTEDSGARNMFSQFEYNNSLKENNQEFDRCQDNSDDLIVISNKELSRNNAKTKPKTRQMGLSKRGAKTSSMQSRLSMFGFQKRPILK